MKTKKKLAVLSVLALGIVVLGAVFIFSFFSDQKNHGMDDPSGGWIPENTPLVMSETVPLPELAQVIAETYKIPREDWADTHYYYNYVDLNEDGEQEIFVVVTGMYTSGSGGDSAMLVLPYAAMTVSQTFNLVRTPILISDKMTGGAHDLIFMRSGGGGETQLVKLTCVDGVYSMVSNAEVLPAGEPIHGTAILGNDFGSDFQTGKTLTLADS